MCCPYRKSSVQEDDYDKSGLENSRFVDCSRSVRILVLFTQNAQNAVPNINQTAALAIQQTNDALINSAAFTEFTTVTMAGPVFVNFNDNATGDMWQDVQTLAGRVDIQTLRNNNGADLVVLLTNGNYGGVAGIVREIGPNNPFAYSIVQVGAATGSYTFAHEIGHLFGARHQQCNIFQAGGCDDTPGFAHGYGFQYGLFNQNKRSTVMHQLRSGYSRILHYANPNISYSSQSTGTANGNNNARQLIEQAPVVSGFRPFIGQLSASVEILPHLPGFRRYQCRSVSICGLAPHSFEWRISHNGFNYGSVVSTQETYSSPRVDCNNLFVWLKIRSSDNQEADHFFTLSRFDNDCDETRRQIIASILQEGEDGSVQEGESEPLNESLLYVYPNPADKAVNVNYFMSEPGSYRVTLSDAAGKLVYGKNYGNREQGWQQMLIETSGLPNGIYMLVLESNRERKVKKIIIQK